MTFDPIKAALVTWVRSTKHSFNFDYYSLILILLFSYYSLIILFSLAIPLALLSSHPSKFFPYTCCPWFTARSLLHTVRQRTISDAILFLSLSEKGRNVDLVCLSFSKCVNIYFDGTCQQAVLYYIHLLLDYLTSSHVTGSHVFL